MLTTVMSMLLASAVSAGDVESGTLLTYRGTLIADKGDPALTRKSFELDLLVSERDADSGTVLWTLAEEGRGGWPWPDRFGNVQVDAQWSPTGLGPALLYERPEGLSIVSLVVPLLARETPLAKGKEWSEGRLIYQVEAAERIGERDAWRVSVGTLYGTKRTLWVDKQSPRVLRMREKVFIGQGEEHELKLELAAEKQLDGDALERARRAFEALDGIKETLGHEPRTPRLTWSDDQLAALREKIEGVVELAADTPLAELAGEAAGDTKTQKNRAAAIEVLAKRIVGKAAPEFELATLDGGVVKSEDLQGKVTVLHFWEYRDTPLEEPYGQIGYLDFLHRQHKGDDVQVYGVAVDERLAGAATRRSVISGAKKLRSFMNLGYGVLLDDGNLLKAFGDPRITGAKLPVYVVIDATGNVAHYHVGYYEVDRDRGLKELDDVVTAAGRTGE